MPCGGRGVAHAPRLVEAQGQRTFAEHMLAGLKSRNHGVMMHDARRADIDTVDVVAPDDRGRVGEGEGLAERGNGIGPRWMARQDSDHRHPRDGGIGGGMHGPMVPAPGGLLEPQSSQPACLTWSR